MFSLRNSQKIIRKVIIMIFILGFGLLLSNYLKKLNNKFNDIDDLENLIQKVLKTNSNSQFVYYFSNSESEDLFSKAQFVMVPSIVVKDYFKNIPIDNYCLVILDRKITNNIKIADSLTKFTNKLFSEKDNSFEVLLIKKK